MENDAPADETQEEMPKIDVVPEVETTPETIEVPVIEEPLEVEELPEVEELEEIQEADNEEPETEPKKSVQEPEELEQTDELAEEQTEAPEIAPRVMTEEETALFAPFVQTKSARNRLIQALDNISLAAYTGNVFVTGETQDETMELAKNVIRDIQITDPNFSGKIAKVTGSSLNTKDIL